MALTGMILLNSCYSLRIKSSLPMGRQHLQSTSSRNQQLSFFYSPSGLKCVPYSSTTIPFHHSGPKRTAWKCGIYWRWIPCVNHRSRSDCLWNEVTLVDSGVMFGAGQNYYNTLTPGSLSQGVSLPLTGLGVGGGFGLLFFSRFKRIYILDGWKSNPGDVNSFFSCCPNR